MLGSELGAFAPSEALSVPSTRAKGEGRSRDAKLQNLVSAKSAEGTKIMEETQHGTRII